jgi:hypothetical protein
VTLTCCSPYCPQMQLGKHNPCDYDEEPHYYHFCILFSAHPLPDHSRLPPGLGRLSQCFEATGGVEYL